MILVGSAADGNIETAANSRSSDPAIDLVDTSDFKTSAGKDDTSHVDGICPPSSSKAYVLAFVLLSKRMWR
jgi:hypothetical protein